MHASARSEKSTGVRSDQANANLRSRGGDHYDYIDTALSRADVARFIRVMKGAVARSAGLASFFSCYVEEQFITRAEGDRKKCDGFVTGSIFKAAVCLAEAFILSYPLVSAGY